MMFSDIASFLAFMGQVLNLFPVPVIFLVAISFSLFAILAFFRKLIELGLK